MVEPDFDWNGRLIGLSLVKPITGDERAALIQALKEWKNQPIVWTHDPPTMRVIQLHGRWEPDIEDTP